ncbi:MAG: hypothetical protein JXM79_06780 [Sedimentisphaerales bacterium]|nr:hypothetical protein [Sedimentisphaerales bacterium]
MNYEEYRKTLDKVFKRDDIRGSWGEDLCGNVAWDIGRAFYTILNKEGAHIVVGRDMRTGSPEMADQLVKGFQAAGGKVTNVQLCGSEMIYFAAGEGKDQYDGGAMVTASHNPPSDAGVKFVKQGAEPLSSEELKKLKDETGHVYLLKLQEKLKDKSEQEVSDNEFDRDFRNKLIEMTNIKETARSASDVKNVLIEAGNGMGGFVFKRVDRGLKEEKVPVDFIYSNEKPDGTFPVCTPNPLLPDYQRILKYNILDHQADLGICFDGDADRAGFSNKRGEVIDASLVSIVLCKTLAPLHPERNIVMGNLNTSLRFTDYIEKDKKLQFIWTPVGHAKIKQLMRNPPEDLKFKSDSVLFASEHSGHYFYPDFFYADSGMTTSLFMIKALIQNELDQVLKNWREGYFHSGEINQKLDSDEQAINVIKEVAEKYNTKDHHWRGIVKKDDAHIVKRFAKQEQYEKQPLVALDLRVDAVSGDWWFSLRKSGNEPQLRLNVEARNEQTMTERRDSLLGMMRKK